jgi:putative ABC transport system permease protein
MKSVFIIAIKGIFKRKTYTVAIFFLAIVAAISMATTMSTIFRIQDTYDGSYSKSNSPDIFYGFANKDYRSDFVDFFKNRDEIESVSTQDCLLTGAVNIGSINGKDLSNCIFQEYDPQNNNFNISADKSGKLLSDHEVYVPLIYKNQFDAKIGDKLIIHTGQSDKDYIISGYMEDPCFGQVFFGIKRILFSSEGYKQVAALTENKTTLKSTLIKVYLKDKYQGAAFDKTSNDITGAFGKDMLTVIKSDKSFCKMAAMMIPNIISVVLFCFSVLLIIIVAIVIRHAIFASIEADYVSLGVLKAIGFTGGDIIASTMIQYLTVSGIGTASGIAGALLTTPIFGEILISTAGILWSGNMTLLVALAVFAVIMLFICAIVFLTAKKAAKISPVRAISFGKSPVYFSSRLNFSLEHFHFFPLSVKMPFTQMLTKLKQYSALIVITSIFTFMIITVTTTANAVNSNEKLYKALGVTMYDFDVSSAESDANASARLDRIVDDIDKTYGVKLSGSEDEVSIKLDGISVDGLVKGDINSVRDSLLDGKLPRFNNEIAITPILSKILNKSIGDSVEIESKSGNKNKYVITGTVQCVYEMGKNITMPLCAYQRIDPDYQSSTRSIVLKDSSKLDSVISNLKQKYKTTDSDVSFTNDRTESSTMFNTIDSAVKAATSVINALTFILIACITVLLCMITIYKEITDTGIFKAIGFKTIDLRLQFTFRFMLISILGSFIGTTLSILIVPKLLKGMFSSVGIAELKWSWDFWAIGFPIIFVIAVTGITAFLCSMKIKKISPNNLISE